MARIKAWWALLLVLTGLLIPAVAEARSGPMLLGPPCTLATSPHVPATVLLNRLDLFDCTKPDGYQKNKTNWALFKRDRLPPLERDSWVFAHRYGRDTGETVWFVYDDGVRLPSPTTAQDAIQSFSTADVVFDIPARNAAVTAILVQRDNLQFAHGLAPNAKVETRSSLANRAQAFHLFYGLFMGMMFITLLYSLALFTVMRHRFLLAYGAFTACIMAFCMTWSGGVSIFLPHMDSMDQARANYFAIGLCSVTAGWFIRSFIEREAIPDTVNHLLSGVAILPLVAASFRLVAPYWNWPFFDALFFTSLSLSTLSFFGFAVLAASRGSKAARLITVGWCIPIFVAVSRSLWGLDLLHVQSDLFDVSIFLSMGIQVVVTALGIVMRIRQIRQERDEARTRELAMRELAATDPLTGLLNRRAFVERCKEGDYPKRLILIDVDHFKAVNDRYGHQAGDDVLIQLARLLKMTAPQNCLIGRLGGEEFALALRADMSPTLADVIRRRVAQTRFGTDLKLTVSVGYALGPITSDAAWKALYTAADHALYAAKDAGRNRVRKKVLAQAA